MTDLVDCAISIDHAIVGVLHRGRGSFCHMFKAKSFVQIVDVAVWRRGIWLPCPAVLIEMENMSEFRLEHIFGLKSAIFDQSFSSLIRSHVEIL